MNKSLKLAISIVVGAFCGLFIMVYLSWSSSSFSDQRTEGNPNGTALVIGLIAWVFITFVLYMLINLISNKRNSNNFAPAINTSQAVQPRMANNLGSGDAANLPLVISYILAFILTIQFLKIYFAYFQKHIVFTDSAYVIVQLFATAFYILPIVILVGGILFLIRTIKKYQNKTNPWLLVAGMVGLVFISGVILRMHKPVNLAANNPAQQSAQQNVTIDFTSVTPKNSDTLNFKLSSSRIITNGAGKNVLYSIYDYQDKSGLKIAQVFITETKYSELYNPPLSCDLLFVESKQDCTLVSKNNSGQGIYSFKRRASTGKTFVTKYGDAVLYMNYITQSNTLADKEVLPLLQELNP